MAYEESEEKDLLPAVIAAYGSGLLEMGSCSQTACPGLGDELRRSLGDLAASLSVDMTSEALAATDKGVEEQLRSWGCRSAAHNQEQTNEVKELLIVMARTAESVGTRDQRCAGQISEVTTRLKAIASLEDLTEIRATIKNSAAELKTSIDRMTAEGKAAVEQLRTQVSTYQTRLEKAEKIASRDALTGLLNRLCVEHQIERHIAQKSIFCVAMVDIDGFKNVNDNYGHLTGDEVLKQFAAELRSVCRSSDVIGRWGGDEFIILLECGLDEARAQADRLRKWACGDYKVQGRAGAMKLSVDASIGLAEHGSGETIKELLARADAAMYEQKPAGHSHSSCKSF
jgi:diguanylate cyclase (GGDEF)-like protein